MKIVSYPESAQDSTVSSSNIITENILKPFFVPQSEDEDFNDRMKENKLHPRKLNDIYVQEFMDKGYSQDKAVQRVSQYALLGAYDIPGQLSIFNQFFDENTSNEVKETFRDTLKSSFDKMSNDDISQVISEILPTIKKSGLTPISSQLNIKNKPHTYDLNNINTSDAASNLRHQESMMRKSEPFSLGEKVYYFNDKENTFEDTPPDVNLFSTEAIKDYFNGIWDKLNDEENNSELTENEKNTISYKKEIFEGIITELKYIEEDKTKELENNQMLLKQYTKNNKTNPLIL